MELLIDLGTIFGFYLLVTGIYGFMLLVDYSDESHHHENMGELIKKFYNRRFKGYNKVAHGIYRIFVAPVSVIVFLCYTVVTAIHELLKESND